MNTTENHKTDRGCNASEDNRPLPWDDMSMRLRNILQRAKIFTVKDTVEFGRVNVMDIRNMGITAMLELDEIMEWLGATSEWVTLSQSTKGPK